MADLPADHVAHLDRRPFVFGCATDIFPVDEWHALSERGNWMEALVAGTIQPLTAEHKRFLRVDREEIEPSTVDERAWIRLKGRREFEKERAAVARPEPAENYGIIEWDREKCWW
jgi:uncharacterized protein YifE (UPF0438 family)